MMVNYLAVVFGITVGLYIIIQFKKTGLEKKHWVYPALLATFPVYYWLFAISASDYAALEKEAVIGFLFVALALIAYKIESFAGLLLLGMGYVCHAIYDVGHNQAFVNQGTPLWWPEFCGAVDLLVSLYIFYYALSSNGCQTKNA